MADTKKNPGGDLPGRLTIKPLRAGNWEKLVQLFGEKGACGNCWCMYYRLSNPDFKAGKQKGGNREALHSLAMQESPTGLIGFYEGLPVAWCAFAPREHYARLEKSRVHKRIDNLPVWSIPCFFIDKRFRNRGLSVAMLKAVIRYAGEAGIKVIEAYPVIPTKEKLPDAFAWVGLYRSFDRAGFKVVDNTSKNRPMVRYYLSNE